MQVEFDTSCSLFRDIPCNSIFVWNFNNRVYLKTFSHSAVDLGTQTPVGFDSEDEVIPCTITKIVVRKK